MPTEQPSAASVRTHSRSTPMTKEEREAIAKFAGHGLGMSVRFGPFLFHTGGDGRGYFNVALGRKWHVLFGKVGIPARWQFAKSKQFDYRVRTNTDRCVCGHWLELRGWKDWTLPQWLYCPGCRYRLKTRGMLAGTKALRDAEGIT